MFGFDVTKGSADGFFGGGGGGGGGGGADDVGREFMRGGEAHGFGGGRGGGGGGGGGDALFGGWRGWRRNGFSFYSEIPFIVLKVFGA